MNIFRLHSDNLDEILFENRNKAYGAYELRKSHDARVVKSFLLAICSLTFLIVAPILIHHLLSEKKIVIDEKTFHTIPLEFSKNFKIEQTKPVEPSHSDPQRSSIANAPFKVVKDSLIADDKNKKDTLPKSQNTNLLATNTSGDTTSNNKNGTPSDSSGHSGGPISTTASIGPFNLASVDKVPEFPGGENAMMSFLEKNIHFNQVAKENGISGKVHVSFIINTKGEIEAIKVIRHLGFGLDEEVVRVVAMMPKWKPGYFRDNAVSTILNLPVSFNLLQ